MFSPFRIFVFGVVVIVFAGVTGMSLWYSVPRDQEISCTQDAKVCPDGTFVAREGPSCEFAACPEVNKEEPKEGKIVGKVFLGPTCPVERFPPDPNCADRPYAAQLMLTKSKSIVQRFSADEYGTFMLTVPSGQYQILSAETGLPFPRCSVEGLITVVAGEAVTVEVRCDSGIR